MKIICGILQQDSGEIKLDNRPMTRNKLHKKSSSLIETPATSNNLQCTRISRHLKIISIK